MIQQLTKGTQWDSHVGFDIWGWIDNKGLNFEIVDEQSTQEFDRGQVNEREKN